ncbi:MAG: ABC transporter ATP-binding protein/permease [Lachnospiraceae bacterium]|nr:ABC transporter ATP-binding protein/permease [Lachnospiraceae bacterium]
MKRLLKYLHNYRKESILAPLFKMLEAAFELFVPLVIAALIDRITDFSQTGDRSFILKCFALLLILGLVGLVSSCTAQYFAAKAATGFSKELRHDLFAHLLSLGYPEIDRLGTSTMITRMTADVNTAQNGVNMFLRLFLRSPFIVAGAVVMAFTIDAFSAGLFVGVVILLFLAVGLIMRSNIPLLKKVQTKLDGVLNLTRESLSGARVIRAFTLEEQTASHFREENGDLSRIQQKAGRISGLLNPLTYVMINLGIVFLIRLGGIRVSNGALTTGQVVALYNYMSQILLELIKFANLIVTINRALASANRIGDVFEIPSEDASGDPKRQQDLPRNTETPAEAAGTDRKDKTAHIEFRNVSLRYHENSDEVLTGISFRAEKGQTIGIIGGTGSGKTSLINLIPRFYDATGGQILIDGTDIRELDRTELKKRVGIVPQKAVLFSGTIAENLRWGNPGATMEELDEALRLSVAEDVVRAKGGPDAVIEQNGRNLSGGQRQRLTIARALVKKPEILILDDASSALDNMTDLKLRTNLRELSANPTVFIVSQRSSSVMGADLIIVLDDGEAVGMGTHEELLKTCEVYREIYETQFKKEA